MRTHLALPFLFAALTAASGCSLVVNFEECSSNAECSSGICSDGICEETPTCTKKSECSGLSANAHCLAGTCVVIDNTKCPLLLPKEVFEGDENIIPIGGLMPLSGPEQDNGEGTIQGANIAVQTINKSGGVAGAKLGLVVCDTQYQKDLAVEQATYLAGTLGVRAAVGAISSAETIEVVQKVARTSEMLLISPASTSPSITSLPDDGLLWRTIGSDDLQAAEMAKLVDQIGATRVAVLAVSDAYGDGFLGKLNDYWLNNGRDLTDAATFKTLRYDAGAMLNATTLAALGDPLFGDGGLKPQAVVIVGSSDAQNIIKGLEDAYGSSFGTDKPMWVLSEGGKKSGLLQDDFRDTWSRIIGTDIGKPKTSLYVGFTQAYNMSSGRTADAYTFSSKAHDAAFLIGIAFGAQKEPLKATGAQLAATLKNVSTGDKAEATGEGFGLAVGKLGMGQSVDFDGVSGPVDLDPDTGDSLQENYVYWTITESGGSAQFSEYMPANGN